MKIIQLILSIINTLSTYFRDKRIEDAGKAIQQNVHMKEDQNAAQQANEAREERARVNSSAADAAGLPRDEFRRD